MLKYTAIWQWSQEVIPQPSCVHSSMLRRPRVSLPRNVFISCCRGMACWEKSRILWPSSGEIASGFRHFLVSHLGVQKQQGLGIILLKKNT